MVKNRFLIILWLALLTTSLFWGVDQGRAESQDTSQPTAITGPFRDPENVPKHRSTTKAQRAEAARKAAEYRAEAARAAALKDAPSSGSVPPDSPVPPTVKGGTHE
jgi:hypothetical protein